ncbi:hypothetical protein FRC10_003288 [Ceratobasidium sp. 414]|nr:hypothetical protein FRC10_003288 [Ceratobasidium sp. 414]
MILLTAPAGRCRLRNAVPTVLLSVTPLWLILRPGLVSGGWLGCLADVPAAGEESLGDKEHAAAVAQYFEEGRPPSPVLILGSPNPFLVCDPPGLHNFMADLGPELPTHTGISSTSGTAKVGWKAGGRGSHPYRRPGNSSKKGN